MYLKPRLPSHEIKLSYLKYDLICMLIEQKPTKVHLVKSMFFPVVIYGCESWIIKKAER